MKNITLAICLLWTPVLSLAACGTETAEIHDAVLAVSPDYAVDTTGTPLTQVWIVEQKDGKCVVLDEDVTVTVNGKPAEAISRGAAPGWISERYNRYAGCGAPLFRISGATPQAGSEVDVDVSGDGISASTHMIFSGGAWGITQCQGVRSCCASDSSASPIACLEALAQ